MENWEKQENLVNYHVESKNYTPLTCSIVQGKNGHSYFFAFYFGAKYSYNLSAPIYRGLPWSSENSPTKFPWGIAHCISYSNLTLVHTACWCPYRRIEYAKIRNMW
jgi:hypothetical protein